MCFPVSVTEVNSLQYFSTNVAILLVKVVNTTFLTYSAVAPIPMFLSFPPNPPELCPVLGHDMLTDLSQHLFQLLYFHCCRGLLNSANHFVQLFFIQNATKMKDQLASQPRSP